MRILIIEDEYGIADAILEMLKKENFLVDIITDGEEGENEALTGIYDLIILDVMLPGKNGFEILKTLKREKIKTPIIKMQRLQRSKRLTQNKNRRKLRLKLGRIFRKKIRRKH